ncbi:MAG TPA: hypothetical protein VKS79_18430 [Gemmataceae bacterium]|nr:hypothetical protein [Gemmataceae bacterium]
MFGKRFLATALVLTLGFVTSLSHGQEKKKDENPSAALMKKKLAASQKLLEGLANNDFAMIKENADTLHDISREASFKALKTPRYELYADEFQQTAEKLAKAAKDKNLDAAALAYVDLTLNCVKCHQHVREVRMTKGDEKLIDKLTANK